MTLIEYKTLQRSKRCDKKLTDEEVDSILARGYKEDFSHGNIVYYLLNDGRILVNIEMCLHDVWLIV